LCLHKLIYTPFTLSKNTDIFIDDGIISTKGADIFIDDGIIDTKNTEIFIDDGIIDTKDADIFIDDGYKKSCPVSEAALHYEKN
jgi:hypothetical protein